MRPQLYPPELVEHFLESYLARHSGRSQAIYLALLVAVAAGVAALPLVRVGVSVQSPGLIRPATEKHELSARVAGFAESIRLRENGGVREGEVLLTLSSAPLDGRARLAAAQLAEQRRLIHDLERLTGSDAVDSLDAASLRTGQYAREYAELQSAAQESGLKEERAIRQLARERLLYERELVPRTELEEARFALEQARMERTLLVQRSLSGWQSALAAARAKLRELAAQEAALRDERGLYTVRAPVAGTVEQVTPLAPGSYLQAGERLAVISPSAALTGEVFVSPRDIGLIRPGGVVRMQIDAFNYNDWGLVTGRVSEIPEDFTLIDGQPVFRVRTTLDQDALTLKNGVRGRLRKGMTLRARFLVTERTLLQLLRDDLNDWLNPVAGG